MSFEQAAILLLLLGMLIVFALDRFRMELVALAGLTIGLALGIVAPAQAFAGFANPAFITVLEILLIVSALGRSGILDPLARRIPEIARTETGVLAMLCVTTALLSVFMNNIGALALMLPVVTSVCRVSGLDMRRALMPVSFAALLGGLCSVIGTPANLIVSNQLAAATGAGFGFFDFAWVGIPTALAGLCVLVFGSRRTLAKARGDAPQHEPRTVVSEIEITPVSSLVGASFFDTGFTILAMRRGGAHLLFQQDRLRMAAGDILVVEAGIDQIQALLSSGAAILPGRRGRPAVKTRVAAVVMPQSMLVGSRVGALAPLASRGIDVVAVASRAHRVETSLADLQLSIGDVLYLAGDDRAIEDAVEEADILALQPDPATRTSDTRWSTGVVFAAGVVLAAFDLLQPPFAFGLVVIVLAILGSLDLRRALGELDWSILVMLATMITLGSAIETTGAASVLGAGLVELLPAGNVLASATAMLLLAVAITPFVNNASTAVVLAPVALGIAGASGMPPGPLLIAVALGASIDFLTPIGHHNNTIVMGIAGYRFSDFLKAGWPVTVVVVGTSILCIGLIWT